MTMASKKSATGSGLKAVGPPAIMSGNRSSLSFEKKGIRERSSILRTLVKQSSYWRENPRISNWLSGVEDSREERGTPFSLNIFSISIQGAKALSHATPFFELRM